MSDPAKFAIPVPSKDPASKKPDQTDKEEGTSKLEVKKDEEKDGDELVLYFPKFKLEGY